MAYTHTPKPHSQFTRTTNLQFKITNKGSHSRTTARYKLFFIWVNINNEITREITEI